MSSSPVSGWPGATKGHRPRAMMAFKKEAPVLDNGLGASSSTIIE
jgi:hypothetical protein